MQPQFDIDYLNPYPRHLHELTTNKRLARFSAHCCAQHNHFFLEFVWCLNKEGE